MKSAITNRLMRWVGLSLILYLPGLQWALAQDMPVPPAIQAALFKKVFAYDKKLSTVSEIKVVVVFVDSSASSKEEMVKAFKGAEVPVSAVKADQLAANLGDASVVYIAAGAGAAKSVCQKNKILSITGIPSLVESGDSSIGIGIADGKPKIIIHMGELKAEGHEVSAKLLQLAKVIE